MKKESFEILNQVFTYEDVNSSTAQLIEGCNTAEYFGTEEEFILPSDEHFLAVYDGLDGEKRYSDSFYDMAIKAVFVGKIEGYDEMLYIFSID